MDHGRTDGQGRLLRTPSGEPGVQNDGNDKGTERNDSGCTHSNLRGWQKIS